MRWLIMFAIHDMVMSVAQAMEPTMRGSSHGRACARKHSGIIQQTKGWRNVTLRTLTKRSMERGANQESCWGGRGGIGIEDDIVREMCFREVRLCSSGMLRKRIQVEATLRRELGSAALGFSLAAFWSGLRKLDQRSNASLARKVEEERGSRHVSRETLGFCSNRKEKKDDET
jgi:hypothetical protein